ncbi:MAG: N-6 DNA methylase [Candidatus Dojkabacteria bacterium]|nr:MAG: N-6 DNA methylase [Candidatus Dojkabacteria bacterium]
MPAEKHVDAIFTNYLESVSRKFKNERTSEMGYRAEFEQLLKNVFEEIGVKDIGHDEKSSKGNKPDFIVYSKARVPLLYIEVKDIGVSLDKIEQSEQIARYFGYDNLVLTDYLEFRFYRNGHRYQDPVKIAVYDKKGRTIEPQSHNYQNLAKTLLDFTKSHKEPIKSGLHLAKVMGGKARRIRDNILEIIEHPDKESADLEKVFDTIKTLLVHDLKIDDFADMYAQTLVYGLFVARFYDESEDSFSREEARELIPASNPFLRHFFDHIAGPNFNVRLKYIVDELCEVLSHADIEKLMDDYYGKQSKDRRKAPDPVIHFYEDFLKEYDPVLRKKMGAYYTPVPVVDFIVRSVDHILKKDFSLPKGLSDTSKDQKGNHIVQVLDPAVGTGTFFSAVIRHIYAPFAKNENQGAWHKYVHNELLPRLHGFELMMAPYTIAHLRLTVAFKKTDFIHFNKRLGIYLTNSLDDLQGQDGLFAFGFADSIAQESEAARKIKHDTPVMVVLGNPPYSVSSQNKGEWIESEVKEYKKDLNERNIQPLSDDYIKFIRFAEQQIEKNGSGIVAMITNNSFLDGIIHRQMRKHLLETFDDIYVVDLHGNSKKKEMTPDGGKDENVFDIQQGVSINFFVKKPQI